MRLLIDYMMRVCVLLVVLALCAAVHGSARDASDSTSYMGVRDSVVSMRFEKRRSREVDWVDMEQKSDHLEHSGRRVHELDNPLVPPSSSSAEMEPTLGATVLESDMSVLYTLYNSTWGIGWDYDGINSCNDEYGQP